MSLPAPEPARRPALPRAEHPPAIPGYQVEGVLGRGSSGIVYRARQLAVERDVALKVLHPELSREPRIVRRLQREARTTARLAHPNVVSAIDMGETDGRWWYAMELVDGPALSERLRSVGRLSEREALRLFIPLCEALEHLWENGVVHRDIKPANILIDRTGVARLADLGLAFADDDPGLTQAGGTLGTPHYISPEQAVDPKSADVQSDLWSFGATLFHAVCGEPPFAGTSAAEILSGVLYERIPDPLALAPELSKGLALVLRKCLVRDVRRRYATPRELRLDLERVRERRAPNVSRARLDPVRRGSSGRPVLAWLAGLVAALALGWWVLDRARREPSGALGAAGERAAWDPVDDLRRRFERGEPAALLYDELETRRAGLDEAALADAGALGERLRAELSSAVLRLTRALDLELQALFATQDLAAARELVVREAPARLRTASGTFARDLPGIGTAFDAWRERAELALEERLQAARTRLGADLAAWRRARLGRADLLQAEGAWNDALELLRPSDEEIQNASSAPGMRFPDGVVEEQLAGERLAFHLRRQRLEDEWRLLDALLRRFVDERAAALAAELSLPPRALDRAGDRADDPGARLRAAFDAELAARGLTRERMPQGLERTSLDALTIQGNTLDELHAQRVEESLRAELDELESIAASFARRREYDAAGELWTEVAPLFAPRAQGEPRAEWMAELAAKVELRVREAELLRGLSERVVEALRALAGKRADLRLGGILYPEVQIEVEEPLWEKGFRIARRAGRLFVQTLPAATFEELAGLTPLAGQSAIGRVRLAAFRLAEGDAAGAQAALDAGPPAASEPWSALAADLAQRSALALELQRSAADERRGEALRLLGIAFDAERASSTPHNVVARIDRLLDAFGDVPEVAERRDELLLQRERLHEGGESGAAQGFRAAYGPTALAFPGGDRVQLAFDFTRADAGAWEPGEWMPDGGAWSLGAELHSWEELARQAGARLELRPPLEVERGELCVSLSLEQPLASEPRLLLVSCAGFHLALTGPGLPGSEHSARWLAGTEPLAEFLQRLQGGEGERAPELLVRGRRHELELVLRRRSGRIEVLLDGRSLGIAHPSPPGAEPSALTVRSWEPVRLLRAVVEAER